VEGIAKVEAEPKLDNRNMIMVLAPDKRARQAAQSRASNQQRPDKSAVPSEEKPAAVEANGSVAPVEDAGGVSEVAASTEEG
jgi:hypothetical protein